MPALSADDVSMLTVLTGSSLYFVEPKHIRSATSLKAMLILSTEVGSVTVESSVDCSKEHGQLRSIPFRYALRASARASFHVHPLEISLSLFAR